MHSEAHFRLPRAQNIVFHLSLKLDKGLTSDLNKYIGKRLQRTISVAQNAHKICALTCHKSVK